MSKTAKAAAGLMIITMLSKVLGFAREMALGNAYGTTGVADAYVIAMNIPTVIFALIGSSLATSYIPLYSEIRENKGSKEALNFSNNVLSIVLLISIGLLFIGFFFTEPIVKLFAIGYKGEQLLLTIKFTRILFISIIFIGSTYIIKSFLESNDDFFTPGISGFPYNIIIISSIVLSVYTKQEVLVWGSLLGVASQLIIQLPAATKKGYRFKFKINIKDENLKKMLILITPILIGASANQLNALVDRTLASTLVEGSVSALNYANRLNQFVIGTFVVSISAVIYPLLSNLSSKNDSKQFGEAITTSINAIALLVLPISIGAIVLAEPIVNILFERGAFTSEATKMTSIALTFYSVGLLAIGIRDILTKAFYSLKDTKTPMKNGVVSVIINIITNLILIKKMGIGGLALATSISAFVGVILLFTSLRKKTNNLDEKLIFSTLSKTFISAILMGIATKTVYNFLISLMGISKLSTLFSLGISIVIGIISYTILVIVLKVKSIEYVSNIIKKYFKK